MVTVADGNLKLTWKR